jgi:cyanophycin synthetase
MVVHGGELIWAAERLVAGVTGDGVSSVERLVEAMNADPRRVGPQAILRPVPLDEEALDLLRGAGLDPASIPAAGRFVRLRHAANLASGGLPVAAFDRVHPDNALLAVRAAAALRLDLAGVDLLIPDIARSWLETGAGICEVNAQPNIGAVTSAHLYAQLLRRIVPASGRIPVVLVLGAPRHGDVVGGLERAVTARGPHVGAADARGMRLGGATIHRGAAPPFAALQALLLDATTAAAIVAVNDASLLISGLPCPAVDLLVLAGDDVDPAPGEDGATTRARLEAALRLQCDGDVVGVAGVKALADAVLAIEARHAAPPAG